MEKDRVIKRKTTAALIFPPCKICTGKATGIHFGINTCESCKAFFRRAVGEENKYKCQADRKCEIQDRKRGNCSACRLQKCLDLGMSRDAVRHGRYTIAIRTKTIMEAKESCRKRKLDNFSDLVTPLEPDPSMTESDSTTTSQSSSETHVSHVSSSSQSDDGNSLSTLSDSQSPLNSPDHTTTVLESSSAQSSPDSTTLYYIPPSRKSARILERQPSQLRAMIEEKSETDTSHEMSQEDIVTMIQTLLASHNAIYPYAMQYWDKEYVRNLQLQFYEKKKLEQETFGVRSYLTTSEFNSVYKQTGIDVDGRLAHMSKAVNHMHRGIVKYIMFAKNIPGFTELTNDDKIALIRGARFEYWLLGHYQHFNAKLGVHVGHEVGMTKEDTHRLFGNSLASVDMLFKFCESLNNLELTYKENTILRGIVILFRDRCPLQEADKIEAIQWKLIQCLKYLIQQSCPSNPTKRFTDIITKLTAMRDLTEINKLHNRRLEGFHMDILRNHQLVYECLMNEDDTQ